MTINGRTKICGLLGCPVEHTVSPEIHNILAERMGINMVYVPFHVEREDLKSAVEGAYGLNLLGLNATVPHKEAVIPCLKEIDEAAADMGSVNTLVRIPGGFKGYNTDVSGLYRAMLSDGVEIAGKDVILLGAGGVGRAVAYMCIQRGVKSVYLLNRNAGKAQEVAALVNRLFSEKTPKNGNAYGKVTAMSLADYKKLPEAKYIAIQATSVGLHPNVNDVIIDDKDFYAKIEAGYDLIYRPSKTRFMTMVEEAGGRAYNGLKMLLYQGVEAFELWNQVQVEESLAMEVYRLLEEML